MKHKLPKNDSFQQLKGFVSIIKTLQFHFPKMRGGEVQDHLELFQKFVRFSRGKLHKKKGGKS